MPAALQSLPNSRRLAACDTQIENYTRLLMDIRIPTALIQRIDLQWLRILAFLAVPSSRQWP
jgi:hypothetical protein